MKRQSKFMQNLSGFFYATGILLGLALASAAVWADLESVFYDFVKLGDEPLSTFKCPIIMTSEETGTITATIKNSLDRTIKPRVRAFISNPGVFRTDSINLSLEPGERQKLSWSVSSKDVDLGFFIMAKVVKSSTFPLPSQEGTCGILVLNLPGLTGGLIYALVLGGSIVSTLLGLGLRQISYQTKNERTENVTRALVFLASIVGIAMFLGVQGSWVLGVLFIAVAVLMIGGLPLVLLTR